MCFEIKEDLPSLRLEVFDILCLIEDHIVPLLPAKDGVVSDCDLVTRDADVKTVQFGPSFPLLLAVLGGAEVGHDLEGRTPSLKLDFPVHEDGGGYDDEVRPPDALLDSQMGQQRNGLDGLAQTHLVCQDAVHPPIVQCRHPVHTEQLVLA